MIPEDALADVIAQLNHVIKTATDPASAIKAVREALHRLSPQRAHPVDFVQWVPVEDVVANDYNPNAVARNEMKLLQVSIAHDGFTQPIVTVFDAELGKFVIVDGFHRHSVAKTSPDIHSATRGMVPVVVLNKAINDRMASTVRHNRARGKHSIAGMASMVFSLLEGGWDDASICNELGMEPDEILRLKHVTGFSRLFENVHYQQAWEMRRQSLLRAQWRQAQAASTPAEEPPKA